MSQCMDFRINSHHHLDYSNEKKVNECKTSQARENYNKKAKKWMEHVGSCWMGYVGVYPPVQKTSQPCAPNPRMCNKIQEKKIYT